MKKALSETQTLRARWLAVRTPPARHKHTDRTDYNTLRRYPASAQCNNHRLDLKTLYTHYLRQVFYVFIDVSLLLTYLVSLFVFFVCLAELYKETIRFWR